MEDGECVRNPKINFRVWALGRANVYYVCYPVDDELDIKCYSTFRRTSVV
jgi:hypothetical protein